MADLREALAATQPNVFGRGHRHPLAGRCHRAAAELNAAGQVEPKLKPPWRDGTTHLAMSPLEFMQRLASSIPPGPQVQEAASEAAAAAECEVESLQARPNRISWARLLMRVFDIDMRHCPNCGAGELKIIAAILERPVIEKILRHLGLDPQPPPKGRAREAGHD